MVERETIDSVRNAGTKERIVTTLRIDGMTCGNCARHVTEALQSVPGVQSAVVTLQTEQADVRWSPGSGAKMEEVIRAVKEAGFEAKPVEAVEAGATEPARHSWHLNLWLGVLVTIPLMLGEWVLGLGSHTWFRWLSFGLAGVVQVFCGAGFYRGAWRQLKQGSSNMDALVSLGSTTAFAYSVWALLALPGAHLYFMEAAAIITLISLGHWLEARVSNRASSALRELLRLAPNQAMRLNADGTQAEAAVSDLRPGDVIVLRPGDHVAVDGQVQDGTATVDESMLTGESWPVHKKPGDTVFAGTVNLDGSLLARVAHTGEETALAHIIAAVQRAQTSRANIQRLGDRVSNVFVPIVVLIALAAGLWWGLAPESAQQVSHVLSRFLWMPHVPSGALAGALITAAAVLIVACPCAMGLATPAAIMAASNAASRRGILIRDGVALEKAGNVTAVLLDKTGTITAGKPEVVEVMEVGSEGGEVRMIPRGETRDSKLETRNKPESPKFEVADEGPFSPTSVAVGLARHSRHPISQAITNIAESDVKVENWEEVRGSGIRGTVAKAEARLGSLVWLKESGVEVGVGEEFIRKWSSQGATIAGLAVGGQLKALFAMKDTLKPRAREMVQRLQRKGLKTFLVTGDTRLTAMALAKEAGFSAENVMAEVRPEGKARIVRQFQEKGESVAFVGDGINDGPALEQADLGIAVTRASDIAREAADIVLLNSDIQAIPQSLGLAQASLRVIKQNLFWAFFYNAVGIPLAALGFMSPVLCAGAMALSDLVVIGNALRLLRSDKSD